MFINPKEVIKNGWLKFPAWMTEEQKDKCVQPNAIDFTLDRVFCVDPTTRFVLSESHKTMREGSEMQPMPKMDITAEKAFRWEFQANKVYDCLSDFYVKVPEGVCAVLHTRSTLVRNGLVWTSGLYDSGFAGHIGGVLANHSGQAVIYQGTRVGQIAFVSSDSAGVYAGGWNHSEGTHYTEK